MKSLAQEECQSCETGTGKLDGGQIKELAGQLSSEWGVIDQHHLVRKFKLKDFAQALALTNRIGQLAEEQGHHPDLLLGWGKVEVTLWTHSVGGLTRADFVFAAKVDELASAGE